MRRPLPASELTVSCLPADRRGGQSAAHSRPVGDSLLARTTPATAAVAKAGVAFTLHTYDYDPDADRVGLQAAEALGEPAERVLKTLMTLVDDRPVCVVLRSDRTVNMKALARAAGGKAARMMPPADAERLTGYKVGGISPFAQKRRAPVIVDGDALTRSLVYVNGGGRGLQIRLAPADLVQALGADTAEVSV